MKPMTKPAALLVLLLLLAVPVHAEDGEDPGPDRASASTPSEAGDAKNGAAPCPPPHSETRPAGGSAPDSPEGSPATSLRAHVEARIDALSTADPDAGGPSRGQRFLTRLENDYAKYPAPPGGLTLPETLGAAVESFLDDLLTRAQGAARERGDERVRVRDVEIAAQAVVPHVVNDRADLVFFPALTAQEQLTITACDASAFDDSGLGWRLLGAALDGDRIEIEIEPDAPATDLVASEIAHYTVLNLRLAGMAARREDSMPFLTGQHVDLAAREIESLSRLDAKAASRPDGA